MMVDSPVITNPQPIEGNWNGGWTLDRHTISSSPTVRTDLGELLYQLKYNLDRSKILPIAELTASFIRERSAYSYINAIVPIPPSNTQRPFQPVFELATQIGKMLNLSVSLDYLVKTRSTEQIKDIRNPELKKQILQEAMQADQRFQEKYILLFDDLYDSGATLMAATDVLLNQGRVRRVSVLTLTRTRIQQ